MIGELRRRENPPAVLDGKKLIGMVFRFFWRGFSAKSIVGCFAVAKNREKKKTVKRAGRINYGR
jgi:hypothetical protein